MKEAVFQITRSAYGKIKKYAEKTYPDEGCGVLLASSTGRIEDVYFANNTVSSGRALNHYRIDPLELYEIENRAADKGYEIMGFFHSHPDCAPVPSKEDADNMIPRMLYIIMSVENGKPVKTKGYIKED